MRDKTARTPGDCSGLGRALFSVSLVARVLALPAGERTALLAAIDAARLSEPADAALVAVAALVANSAPDR